MTIVADGNKTQINGHLGHETVYVDQYVNGILDPNQPMLGPVRDGGHIIANTAPGCWGPMITPEIRGGHEVTRPVAVAGAEVGDAIVIRIKDITVTSMATASGNDIILGDRCVGDPYVAGKCPECGTVYPKTVIKGIGQEAVRCANCGADATPFKFASGYTIAFDNNRAVGVTLDQAPAEKLAQDANYYAAMPENSIQNSVLTFCPADLVGLVSRLRPFMGQLGTTPSMPLPDSHNAGDFGTFLIGAPHEYGIEAEQLAHRTDGHMDIDAVRAGAILICPVKVPGGGVYMGDMHALQGDGEIAGHTADVSGTVTLQVHLIKRLNIDGPIILPVTEDLPFLAKPLSKDEKSRAEAVAKAHGMAGIEESMPISVVGTGPDLNTATDNGLVRAAELLDTTVPAIKNRATITGSIEIGRHPGVVQVTFRAPVSKLVEKGLWPFVQDQYGA